jgi:hypothetical protein
VADDTREQFLEEAPFRLGWRQECASASFPSATAAGCTGVELKGAVARRYLQRPSPAKKHVQVARVESAVAEPGI